jgi:hypothetical protein
MDEKALRRPEFSEGPRVVLGDGQAWRFPKPRIRIVATADESGVMRGVPRLSHGLDHDRTVAKLFEQGDDSEVFAKVAEQVRLAAVLLRRNYDLTADQLDELIGIEFGDAAGAERWARINVVLLYGDPDEPDEPQADAPAE